MTGSLRPSRFNRLSFLLWGWATLFVVLVSAAPGSAAPRSRPIGSAFDPASVSVVVSPKKPRAVAAAEASDDTAPPTQRADGDAAALAQTRALPARLAVAQSFAPPLQAPADPRRTARTNGARAPPQA